MRSQQWRHCCTSSPACCRASARVSRCDQAIGGPACCRASCQPSAVTSVQPAPASSACCRAPCQSQGTGQAPSGGATGRAGLEGSQQLLPTEPGRRQAPSRCHPAGRATARRHDVMLGPAPCARLVCVQPSNPKAATCHPCSRALHQAWQSARRMAQHACCLALCHGAVYAGCAVQLSCALHA